MASTIPFIQTIVKFFPTQTRRILHQGYSNGKRLLSLSNTAFEQDLVEGEVATDTTVTEGIMEKEQVRPMQNTIPSSTSQDPIWSEQAVLARREFLRDNFKTQVGAASSSNKNRFTEDLSKREDLTVDMHSRMSMRRIMMDKEQEWQILNRPNLQIPVGGENQNLVTLAQ